MMGDSKYRSSNLRDGSNNMPLSNDNSPVPTDVAMTYWKAGIRAYEWAREVVRNITFDGEVDDKFKDEKTRDKDEMLAKIVADEDMPQMTEIRRVVPSHCFSPDTKLALFYTGRDLAQIVVLFFVYLAVQLVSPPLVAWLSMPVYWFLQGTLMWAVFVLGHDCGHGSYSRYTLLNDIMGTFLHTIVLVPYYPWKLSHRHHHKHTSDIDHDEIFYPVREKDKGNGFKPPAFGFGLGFAWLYYLVRGYPPRSVSHINPLELMFDRHVLACVSSLVSLMFWVALLYMYACYAGWASLLSHYLLPWFVCSSWLVVVTFLHHTEVGVSWYGQDKWTTVRGRLASVDRDYGWAHSLTHNIGTHQIHHLFTRIPHYHLEEATYYYRKAFPHLVHISDEPILPQFFKMFNIYSAQRFIPDNADLFQWRDK